MAIELPPPETIEQRKARQYATLHHFGIMAHDLGCDAHARAKEQLDPDDAPKPPRRLVNHAIDYAATFASMFRAVRQAIALEHRLDHPPRSRPAYRGAPLPPDPRRTLLRRAFHDAVAKQPDAARRRREIDDRIEQELEADPAHQIPIEELVVSLRNSLQIDLDITRVPDELIGMPPRPYPAPS